jgi:hypothetical protein
MPQSLSISTPVSASPPRQYASGAALVAIFHETLLAI